MTTFENTAASIDLAIGYFMAEQKITRGQMAELMNMSTNTLRSKRSGANDWTLSELFRLADLTGKSLDELAGLA